MFEKSLVPRLVAMFVMAAASSTAACAHEKALSDDEAVRALFLKQVEAENAHDIVKLDSILADGTDDKSSPVSFVARAYQFWGKKEVMTHFEETFKGTWHLDPDMPRIRVITLNTDTVQIYVPTKVTLGAPGKDAVTATYLINQFAVRTSQGWRFTAILPIPAQ
ncbi:hypothetical protein [Caballeronia glathei]|uniref:DUF4440 domain-containing protein n=1 Tax=Caballeronia glathei TaxID=60547 RepID=A0A069PDD9_9BURK|nr:hypothetical protein [Caballeronia glathei]KDR38698.1 hypothetical protein BG61_37795 [Caballeronia glathei]